MVVGETRGAQARVLAQRQVRTPGQAVQARQPPRLVGVPGGAAARLLFVLEVVAKGRFQRRPVARRFQVALGEFCQQQLQAGVVEQGEIHRAMQDCLLASHAQFGQQDRPLIERMAGMVQALAHAVQVRLERLGRGVAAVMHRQLLPWHLGLHPLLMVIDHRAQHRVTLHHGVPGLFKVSGVDVRRPRVFDIQVASVAAIVKGRVASQYIGALYRAQGEGLQRLLRLCAPLLGRKMHQQRWPLGANTLRQG